MPFDINDYSQPRFASNKHPFDEVEWVTRSCGTNDDPEKTDVECPEHWSQRACDVATSKYLRRGNVPEWKGKKRGEIPPITNSRELSIKQLIHRVATFLSKRSHVQNSKNYYEDLCYLMLHQIIGFNTPAWINGGLYDVYGIEGAERTRYWYDKGAESVVELAKEQIRPGMAACYLTGVEDFLMGSGGMYDYVTSEMKVFTVGAGDGANISEIRGCGEPITGGGKAEGLKPFLKIPDASAAYIKSGGVSRRAARMLVCDDDHPDVRFFAQWKAEEEDKAQAMAEGYLERKRKELVAEGKMSESEMSEVLDAYWYELTDFNGEIYATISGQQSNNSIRCSDKFIRAVQNDKEWNLVWRTDPSKKIKIKAKELWDIMCESAWKTGDPGIMYGDTMNEWNTVPHYGEIVTTNPCSEITQPNYTSCNLCTINVVKFEDDFKNGVFENFIDTAKIIILSLETVAENCSHPTARHAKVTSDLRPLGANIANLGAYLMREGLPYDSDEGRRRAASIAALFNAACWQASSELATALGAYPAYNYENHRNIIEMHQESAVDLWDKRRKDCDAQMAEVAVDMYGKMMLNPFRNDAVTCAVPTGTIGFVLDFDTNGIEPEFALVKEKKLSGGGKMHIVNESIETSLENLGYDLKKMKEIKNKIFEERTVVGVVQPEHEAVFDCSMDCSEGRSIAVDGHIKMMGALQPHMSMAMSKTINMPSETTVEDISDAYMLGWTLGLKSMAIYRNLSKMSQPLNVGKKKTKKDKEDDYDTAIAALKEALK